MANLYWVGGANTWNATVGTKWATTSGGVGGAAVPTAADDVFVDASSTGLLTIASGAACRSLNFTGFTGAATLASASSMNIGDATPGAGNIAIKLDPAMTFTVGNAATSIINFTSTSSTQQTVDFGSKLAPTCGFNSAGSNYIISSDITSSSTASGFINFFQGTLDLNGKTINTGLFNCSAVTTRTLTAGSASVICGGTGNSINFGSITGLTMTANTATFTLSGSGTTLQSGSFDFNGASFVFSGTGTQSIAGSAIFQNLTRTGTASKSDAFTVNNQTIRGTLTLQGNSITNRLLVQATGLGTGRTLTAANVVAQNVDFMDITAAGAANWDLSAITGGSGDAGGNTGITFTTSATQTWQGTTGVSWSANAWTSRAPLPQDDVLIPVAFGAAQTITCDMPRLGRSISFAGSTGSPALSMALTTLIFGSLTLASGMTVTGAGTLRLAGRGTHTITSNGVTIACTGGLAEYAPGGMYTQQDACITTGQFDYNFGGWNMNNFDFSSTVLASNVSNARSLTSGTGTYHLTSTAAATLWILGATSLTLNFAGTISIDNASVSTRTVSLGNGNNYAGTFNYTVAGSTGTLIMTSSSTIGTFNFSDATNARTLQFNVSANNTITNWNVFGTAGKLMTVTSTGPSHTLNFTQQASSDYLNVSNSTVTGSLAYAGSHSTDSGSNSGWTFADAPTVPSAPTIGTATGDINAALVTWTAPISDGGSAITSYTIRYYAGGSGTPTGSVTGIAPGATSTNVTGLTAGVSYTFDVIAVNAIGNSTASAKTNSVTPTALISSGKVDTRLLLGV